MLKSLIYCFWLHSWRHHVLSLNRWCLSLHSQRRVFTLCFSEIIMFSSMKLKWVQTRIKPAACLRPGYDHFVFWSTRLHSADLQIYIYKKWSNSCEFDEISITAQCDVFEWQPGWSCSYQSHVLSFLSFPAVRDNIRPLWAVAAAHQWIYLEGMLVCYLFINME